MPVILTKSLHNWVTIYNADDDSVKTFRGSDVRYIEKNKNQNGLWNISVYIHPADIRIEYEDVEEEAAESIFGQLIGMAHKADTEVRCSDCVPKQPKE